MTPPRRAVAVPLLLLSMAAAGSGCRPAAGAGEAIAVAEGVSVAGGCLASLCGICDAGLGGISNFREGRSRQRRQEAPPVPGQDLERLARYAGDANPEVRRVAVGDLIAHLRRATSPTTADPARAQRIAAILRESTGFGGGTDAAAWEAWWREGEGR